MVKWLAMRTPVRIAAALALAAFAALVFHTHVFVGLRPIRAKVVQAPVPAVGGVVRVTTAGFPQLRDLRPPFALIARIAAPSGGSSLVRVSYDGAPVCERSVSGGAPRRIDCAVTSGAAAADREIVLSGPSAPWTLEYLELATHHGNSSGTLTLFVLPWNSTSYVRPAAAWTLVLWMALAAILARPSPPPASRYGRVLYRSTAGVVILLLAISQCSQWISAFRVVLTPRAFIACLAVLLAPRLWRAVRWLLRREDAAGSRWLALSRASLVALLVLAAFLGIVTARLSDSYSGNYSGFLLIARSAFDANPMLNARDDIRRSLLLRDNGYDGQFMYFATFDPLLRAYKDTPSTYRQIMDYAPYRYGRIGYSLLARIVSGGHWQFYPATMVWLILGALALSAFALAKLAQGQGAPAALGLLIVLVPGFWPSLQSGLPEPIAAAALAAGILCFARRRWVLAGALFATALLVRETGIVAVACVAGAGMISGRRRESFFVGLFAVGALALWRLYVAWMLFPDWGLEGLLSNPLTLGRPGAGILDLWRAIAGGRYFPESPEFSRAAVTYPVLLIGGALLSVVLAVAAPSATSIAAVPYALIAVCLNFSAVWVHIGNGQRVTFELFLMLALSTAAVQTYPRAVRAGLVWFWCAAAAYVFFLTFDAASIRSALGLQF